MKALLLLSGGIDSPVAGMLAKNKGIELVAIHFSLEPFTDDTAEKKSIKLAKLMSIKKLYVVKHGEIHAEIVKKINHRYYYIVTRRLMWRVAEKIAEKEKCDFLITGENLGQVGSQTLENMTVIDKAVKIKILRPILCNDKNDTVEIAKKLGTYESSCGPEMCSVLGPKHPATKSTIKIIENEERKIDLQKLLNQSMENIKIVEL
jgi:thiamine biosynthesis protein ThiI